MLTAFNNSALGLCALSTTHFRYFGVHHYKRRKLTVYGAAGKQQRPSYFRLALDCTSSTAVSDLQHRDFCKYTLWCLYTNSQGCDSQTALICKSFMEVSQSELWSQKELLEEFFKISLRKFRIMSDNINMSIFMSLITFFKKNFNPIWSLHLKSYQYNRCFFSFVISHSK